MNRKIHAFQCPRPHPTSSVTKSNSDTQNSPAKDKIIRIIAVFLFANPIRQQRTKVKKKKRNPKSRSKNGIKLVALNVENKTDTHRHTITKKKNSNKKKTKKTQ